MQRPPSEDEALELEEVLSGFMAAYPRPTLEATCEYIAKYPQHACALLEFAVEWAVLVNLRPRGRIQERSAERLSLKALAHLHELFSCPRPRRRAATA